MRTLVASILVTVALAAALLGWFFAGWSGVRAREAELRAAPRRAAVDAARSLAGELVARLEQLRVEEARRPYYHYQSLFHDPRTAAEGLAVAPSPLATGPSDPLVRGHFQVAADGPRWRVTMPTINDDIPALSSPTAVADAALRIALAASAGDLVAAAAGPAIALPTAVASADPPPTKRPRAPANAPTSTDTRDVGSGSGDATQVIELSQVEYAQNMYSNNAYQQAIQNQRRIDPEELAQRDAPRPRANPPPQAVPPPAQSPDPPVARASPPAPRDPQATGPQRRRRATPPATVTIAVAPLEWHEVSIEGARELTALRRVDTPDGVLTQGLVVDTTAVAGWVAEQHAGARLAAASDAPALAAATAPVALGGWRVELPVEGMAGAEAAIASVRAAFWSRFAPVAALAALCGVLVVVVVARAERLASARSRFAAAAAHELRTPLAGLQLYGDMLADGLGDPAKARQYAQRVAEEAARLGRVVANVLGFAQLERGDLSVTPRVTDAAAVAREAVDRARPALERAGMTVEVELHDALAARCDPDAVARILGNLLDNAEKYSRGAAERRVVVTGERAGERVRIEVRDLGPGVAPGARLFVPYARGVAGDGPAGLGLGLALSRSLARSMGGELTHAGGSRFRLELPYAASGSTAV